jgi:hypothetical protein
MGWFFDFCQWPSREKTLGWLAICVLAMGKRGVQRREKESAGYWVGYLVKISLFSRVTRNR